MVIAIESRITSLALFFPFPVLFSIREMSFHTIEKKDLEDGLVHPMGNLLLKLSGTNAMKGSVSSLLETLEISGADFTSLYRFENPYTWFLVPISGRYVFGE
ncbi:hypothetical protein Bpfe_020066 [Biomphalaria pfeifferi]|uniref:Uncharacterized protein n=1 Tax=Biomphalaria pfeifferi TaxID=112525 RepID=A0AAD8F4M8_BIOPF|nr:hypothetical protein Bpfe_020066 [Biomphalaria pfeifferi]